ncbi:hypothetical protein MPTK1_1g10500 [Marchantia polymorpha subsp. ruderalis]|nr:hypothetical protein MARPO_0014s0177 [Marchantia polymorpha]BBM98059.1 hypothetical protein Mp_1g10500 [Marchantia polymorpha subsp. ruderalis]|eukprot:PTQ45667.1 hypothetical protein MARPO_0014s0177 [Marchantia polymorpha]
MGSVRFSVPAALDISGKSQLFGGKNVAALECGPRNLVHRPAFLVRSSWAPCDASGSALRSVREESRIRNCSIFRRSRASEPVRAINSAQYRLEKQWKKQEQGESESEDEDEEDTELCPVECVREFSSQEEFDELLGQAKEQGSLVVVDFFRPSCGSCKYIEKGFAKLCKGAGNSDAHVMFLKHNVVDEYDEQSDVADRLRIKVVPLFHFYKDGVLVESFPTREKGKILDAICKHTELTLEDLDQSGA